MKVQNNVSTNILRDSSKKLDFVVTPNAKEIFERIFGNRFSNNRSFNLIGNYGTGKSTFLWACEKNLTGDTNYFSSNALQFESKNYEFIKLIGEEESLITLFSQYLGLRGRTSAKRIIEQLDKIVDKNKSLVIFIDEFGKILEYNSKQNQSTDLYFLQQLAEWVNDDKHDAVIVTTLHQNFLAYGNSISNRDKIEWEKVKGRFVDVVFNEPVEQLLYFASTKLDGYELSNQDVGNFTPLLNLIKDSNLVSFNNIISEDLIKALYPLDWLSANILVNALQKYGQNERSLFSFLNDNTKLSIHKNHDSFYSVPKVYDYIINSLATEINSPNNSHRAQWLTTFRALERAELFFEEDYKLASDVIKTINLINLFSKIGGRFDEKFIINYFKLSYNTDASDVVAKLHKAGITRFYKHSNKINFLEGTDIDVEQELIDIGRELNTDINYSLELKSLIQLNVMYVKRYSFEKGTKRFFEFKIVNELDDIKLSKDEIDGYINIIFENISSRNIQVKSLLFLDNVFVQIKDSIRIKDKILKVIKFKMLIEKHQSDKNAVKLLNEELVFIIEDLKKEVEENIYSQSNEWVYNGNVIEVNSKNSLLKYLTEICHKIYPKTPTYDNELINRNVLSPPINAAKKFLIAKMLEFESSENLGYEEKKFPPDKAIYISLLKETGLHTKRENSDTYNYSAPKQGSTFYELWLTCEDYLKSTSSTKRSINDLYEMLQNPPFKLKNGFIDFWIPVFLIIRREDYGMFYHDDTFIPFLTTNTLDLLQRKPQDFLVKYYDVSGLNFNVLESYKELVGIEDEKATQSTFLSIYSNFLRFIRGLNNYALNTKNVSASTIKFREAIINSKDPETALFETIPTSLGFGKLSSEKDIKVLESYTLQVKSAITELRNVYSELLNRVEKSICKTFTCSSHDFLKYKQEIKHMLKSIDSDSLIKKQRVYYARLISPLDDRNSWLKSVADVALGKPIEDIIDEEEKVLTNSIIGLSEALIKASQLHEFNKSSKGGKLYSFKLFKANGEVIEERRLIKNKSKNYNKLYNSINTLIVELGDEEKKDLLIELVSKELKAHE